MKEEPNKDKSSDGINSSSESLVSENPEQDDELDQKKRSSRNQVVRSIGYLTQIGITIVATVMLGVFLGRVLDNWLGTSPWLLLLFSLLGAAAAIRALFDMSRGKK
ncbi:MAG TPA: AtpZ/AtpI family protein [Clostridiaceae bacterium]|nr:AtpZ/AtpI family protein [Clostridiaceae bacterium]